ncbi:MAG TPA: TlpA disulfide reductase family protein [Terriglobia bacterium]|nr:TlpA disulfide reductase family protein [Terriglobia bacterium]
MKNLLQSVVVAAATLGLGVGCLLAQADPQAKILSYIRDHLKAGQPVRVTDLYNTVFTTPEDHAALGKLYKDFFRIPTFVVQYQQRFSAPPNLKTIAEQFSLKNPEEADTLLRVMEADPRVPKFITRDPATGEITKVDAELIRDDPRFAAGAKHELGGWVGKTAPSFSLAAAGNKQLTSAGLDGKVALLYVWFTGCPPCMKEAPELARIQRDFGSKVFEVVGANADDLLGLGISDETRQRYAEKEGITFPIARWNKESNQSYGGISIYPTLFLINRQGTITGHWVGFTSPATLREAIAKAIAGSSGKH